MIQIENTLDENVDFLVTSFHNRKAFDLPSSNRAEETGGKLARQDRTGNFSPKRCTTWQDK
jgi:hypothetical protein